MSRPPQRPAAPVALAMLALVVPAFLLAACEGAGDALPASAAETPKGEGDSSGAEAGAPAQVATAPLTGLPLSGGLDADEALARPVVVIKVGNEPSARPQLGLADADIVFATPIEGGGTRFAALYHLVLPELVGPVRSGREADAEVVAPFDPVFAYSGAAPGVLKALRATQIVLREDAQPAGAWRRDPSLPAPHNLFVVPSALLVDPPDLGPVARPWPIDEGGGSPGQGEEVGGVALRYSSAHEARWTWEGASGRWLRSQDGEPHVAAEGSRVTAANVVVARVDARDSDRLDAAGNPVVDLGVEGDGEALVLLGGRAVQARWQRRAGEHFTWSTRSGEPLELLPGPTWVELVPTRGRVEPLPAAVG